MANTEAIENKLRENMVGDFITKKFDHWWQKAVPVCSIHRYYNVLFNLSFSNLKEKEMRVSWLVMSHQVPESWHFINSLGVISQQDFSGPADVVWIKGMRGKMSTKWRAHKSTFRRWTIEISNNSGTKKRNRKLRIWKQRQDTISLYISSAKRSWVIPYHTLASLGANFAQKTSSVV